MTDYNLITIPVVDEQRRMLGVITVDDVLEATLPEDWRRREAAEPPDARHGDDRVTKPEETRGPPPRRPACSHGSAGTDAQPAHRGPGRGDSPATQPATAPDRPAGPQLATLGAVLDRRTWATSRARSAGSGSATPNARGLTPALITLLAIIGPGLIVMVGDNDAGGVSTYAQAGQNYGYSLLWVLLLLIPVLIVNQEMVVRLGAVTGVGHARLINERFGRVWGWFSVGDLFLLNFLTIVTEFIGISLALQYFGIARTSRCRSPRPSLVAIMATGSFRRWERAMFVFIAVSLLLIPMVLTVAPAVGPGRATTSWCPASRAGSARTRCC